MEVMPRYGVSQADVAWKVGRIMLKFRPIAPKPLAGGAVAAGPVDSGSPKGKRRAGEGRRGRKKRRTAEEVMKSATTTHPVVTLPLMPETPERKEESAPVQPSPSPTGSSSDGHVAVSFFGRPTWQKEWVGAGDYKVVAPRAVRAVGSWVTVECVTDTWREAAVGEVGLETDTCPCFISEETGDRVTWTNAAYRRMVVGPAAGGDGEEVRVALVTRGLIPEGDTCGFTCRARVRYACKNSGKVSMAVPCDVWRLAGGRLAWRLDVKAALSLGLAS